jgi:hypothetical protein
MGVDRDQIDYDLLRNQEDGLLDKNQFHQKFHLVEIC